MKFECILRYVPAFLALGAGMEYYRWLDDDDSFEDDKFVVRGLCFELKVFLLVWVLRLKVSIPRSSHEHP